MKVLLLLKRVPIENPITYAKCEGVVQGGKKIMAPHSIKLSALFEFYRTLWDITLIRPSYFGH